MRGGDLHLDEIGKNRGAAGHRRPIAPGFADHGRGFAGDRRFVDRGDAFENLAVAGNDLAGLDQNDIVQLEVERVHDLNAAVQVVRIGIALGRGVGAGLAQRVRLRLAAPLGDRLGEIGEQHREPQPGGDLPGKSRMPIVCEQVAHEQDGDDGRDHLGHEDHGVFGQGPRIELPHGVDCGGADDLGVEKALRLRLVR